MWSEKSKNKSLSIVFLAAIIACCVFLTSLENACAEDVEEKIGFFGSSELQDILQKPFYLYHLDKQSAIPFFVKDYAERKYSLVESRDHVSEIEDPFHCPLGDGASIYCEFTKTFDERLKNKKVIEVFLNKNELERYLRSLSEKVDSEPENGKLKIDENGQLKFSEEPKQGHRLDIEKSYNQIAEVLKSQPTEYYIPLKTQTVEPEISQSNIDDLNIQEKIGEGKSNFKGSTKNRIHNIKVGTSKFDGTLIKPGEEFSFIERLGDVDGENGYKQELVIKKNTTVPEFGGGICQISTTMFRAALNTGLEITERHNHAYPVSYYNPPGSDATVYIPKPDLQFVNDTDNHILIQTEVDVEKRNLFISFYGKSDGRQVEIDGPRITERTPDGKIRTVLHQIIQDKDGKEIRKDTFKSFYDNHDNYPNPNDILTEKPKDWPNKQWEEYYAKYGNIIEQLKNR